MFNDNLEPKGEIVSRKDNVNDVDSKKVSDMFQDELIARELFVKWKDKDFKRVIAIEFNENNCAHLMVAGKLLNLKLGIGAVKRHNEWYILNEPEVNKKRSIAIRVNNKKENQMIIVIGGNATVIQSDDFVFIYVITEEDKAYFIFKVPSNIGVLNGMFSYVNASYEPMLEQLALNTAYILNNDLYNKLNDLIIDYNELEDN